MTKSITEDNKMKEKKHKDSVKKNKNGNWTPKEDSFLINLINILGSKWKFMSKYFPNKSLLQIYNRYFRINPSIKKGRFSEDEDKKILDSINIHGYDWKEIVKCFADRNMKQIRTRYKLHLSDDKAKNDEINYDVENKKLN